jgi:hypothetical protein
MFWSGGVAKGDRNELREPPAEIYQQSQILAIRI